MSDFFGEKVSTRCNAVANEVTQTTDAPDGNIRGAAAGKFCDNLTGLSVS